MKIESQTGSTVSPSSKYKVGDVVVVFKKGKSFASNDKFGKIFTVYKYKKGEYNDEFFYTSEHGCSGFWEHELRLATPLEKALL